MVIGNQYLKSLIINNLKIFTCKKIVKKIKYRFNKKQPLRLNSFWKRDKEDYPEMKSLNNNFIKQKYLKDYGGFSPEDN
jgi:hypothetical protein